MRLFSLVFTITISIALIGCSTSGTTTNSADNQEDSYVRVDQLANHIDTLPRLSVNGNNVINTTANTIQGTPNPLFVIDGVQVGRNFGRVLQLLDPNQEVSVDFLTSSRATTRYGEEGRNGVIIIKKRQS